MALNLLNKLFLADDHELGRTFIVRVQPALIVEVLDEKPPEGAIFDGDSYFSFIAGEMPSDWDEIFKFHQTQNLAFELDDFAPMTLSEAAERFNLNAEYLRVLIHRGKLEAVKIGRDWNVSKASLESYINQRPAT